MVCCKCPGSTIAHAVVQGTDLVRFGVTSSNLDVIIDNRTEYRFSRCGVEKWAFGVGIGRPCLDCISKDPFDWEMSEAAGCAKSLDSFISNNCNPSGFVTLLSSLFLSELRSTKIENTFVHRSDRLCVSICMLMGCVVTINGKRFSKLIPRSKLERVRH